MGRLLPSPEYRPIALLIAAMIGLVMTAIVVVLVALYHEMMDEERARLAEAVSTEAHLFSTIQETRTDRADGQEHAVPRLMSAHLDGHYFGATGEFTLARREGDRIVFLLQRRFENEGAVSIPFESTNAAPMRRALLGHTGTIIGKDYRGETVLAAYLPVPEIGGGLVAKIDMAEIRGPYLRALVLGVVVSLVIIAGGTVIFLRVGGALADRLRASEQRFKTLVETLPYGVQEIDRHGVVQFANAAAHRLHGRADGDLVGRSVTEFPPSAEEQAGLRAELDDMMARLPEPTPHLGRLVRPGGAVRDIRVDWTYRRDETGAAIGFVSVMTDTTEELRDRRQIALYRADLESIVEDRTRELTLSEKRFRAVAENANDAIVTADQRGRIVYWNRKAEQILGYRADEILGSSIVRVLSEDEKSGPSIASTLSAQTLELMGRRQDGSRIPMEVSFAEWVDGEEVFYTGILRDISDRKRAETEIRRAKERFEAVLDNIDATVYVVDIQTHEILYVNRRTQHTYGDIVGKTCWNALRGQTGGPCRLCIVPSLVDGDGRPGQVNVSVRYDESRGRWLECRDQAVHWTDGRLVMMEIATDITGRKQHEAELEARNARIAQQADELRQLADRLDASRRLAEDASRRAQAASQAKSSFLAAMSHELRTPLNSILGFSEIIRDEAFGPGDPERYRDYAGDIHNSGRHLLDLINDILDLSKIEAGKQDLACETLELGSLLRECRRLVRERALQDGITLRVDAGPGACQIVADRRAIKQIILNLLSNALKFTDRGGHVALRAEPMADGGTAIVVEDTGCGIPADRLESVLEPFEQAENGYARARGGTGLGLTLVKSLTELHGGRLEITSAVGEGTRVWVALPGPTAGVEPIGLPQAAGGAFSRTVARKQVAAPAA